MLYEGISLPPTAEETDKISKAAKPPKTNIRGLNNSPLASSLRRRNGVKHKDTLSNKEINVHWYGI